MNRLRLTADQLARSFATARMNLFGVVEYLAEVKTLAKGRDTKRPAADIVAGGEVFKWSKVYIQPISDYETAVLNAQGRDGNAAPEFEAKAHSWAVPFEGSKVVKTHKDWPARSGFYLQVRCPKNLPVKVEFRDRTGHVLPFAAISEILPTSELPATKAVRREHDAERQGVSVENVVTVRDYAVSNIIRLTYGGTVYEIISEAVTAAESAKTEAVQDARLAMAEAEEAAEEAAKAEAKAADAAALAKRLGDRAAVAMAEYEAAEAAAVRKGMAPAAAVEGGEFTDATAAEAEQPATAEANA